MLGLGGLRLRFYNRYDGVGWPQAKTVSHFLNAACARHQRSTQRFHDQLTMTYDTLAQKCQQAITFPSRDDVVPAAGTLWVLQKGIP